MSVPFVHGIAHAELYFPVVASSPACVLINFYYSEDGSWL